MHCFVILHYKNLSDTLECVSSIKNILGKKKIIVVDNHTLTSSEKNTLESEVDDLLCLDENIGFAKANNIGVQLAINKYKPMYVTVINNDTVILDKKWIDKIKEIDGTYHFDLLGPKIICEEGLGSVNPYRALTNIKEVKKEIRYQKKLYFIYKHKLLTKLLDFYVKTKAKLFPKPVLKNGVRALRGVALHGCCIIFSKKYLEKFKEAFYPNTFLFHEESFLYQRVRKYHLISVYDPSIEIIHKEGSSIKDLESRQKKLFRTTEILKSLSILLKEMEEEHE